MSAQPWWRRVKRWGQTNHTEDDPVRCDIGFWREYWAKTRVQGVIVNAGGIVSYYPSASPLQYRAAMLGERDFFGEFAAAAREAGLAVVARMDVNRCTEDFYRAHPDWFCVDREGKPIMSQDRYFSCVNGGYYEQFIPEALREIVEKYHPDGFTDNSWSGTGRRVICYCANCRDSFRKATGLSLPAVADWSDPAYDAWVDWGTNRRTEIWDLFNRVTTAAGGPDCLWSGMLHADATSGCDSLRDLKALCAQAKIIFTDHQSRDELNGFEQNSLNGALLRLASGDENTLAPESIAHYTRGKRAFRLSANPAQESRMWLVDGIAGGMTPWYHHIGGSTRDRRQFDTSPDIFAWHEANQDVLYDRGDLANIGLLWDQHNAAHFGRGERRARVQLPWRGFHFALTRARMPFLPLNAQDVAGQMGRLDALILPNVAMLREDAREAVLRHLDKGCGLVLTGAADSLDFSGKPIRSPLWERLGMEFTGEELGVGAASPSWDDCGEHNYLRLPDGERHEILAGFENTQILPMGGRVRRVASPGALRQVASFIPAFPIYPPEFAWIREERPQIGTVYAGELPSGARVVYFAADLDRACGELQLPDMAALLANAARWAARGKAPIRVEGPGYLDCKAYAQGGRVLVHIVNLSGLNLRGYAEESYPVGPLTVRVRYDGPDGRAALRVAGGETPFVVKDGYAQLRLESLGEHELIVIG